MSFKDKWRKTNKPFSLRDLSRTHACMDGRFITKKYIVDHGLEMDAELSDNQFAEMMDSAGYVHEKWLYEKGYIAPLHKVALIVNEKIKIGNDTYTLELLPTGEYGLMNKKGKQHGRLLKSIDGKISKKELQYMLKDQSADMVLKTKEI